MIADIRDSRSITHFGLKPDIRRALHQVPLCGAELPLAVRISITMNWRYLVRYPAKPVAIS